MSSGVRAERAVTTVVVKSKGGSRGAAAVQPAGHRVNAGCGGAASEPADRGRGGVCGEGPGDAHGLRGEEGPVVKEEVDDLALERSGMRPADRRRWGDMNVGAADRRHLGIEGGVAFAA